ncbi:hypothetical protein QFZ24_005237 [Streptomyces phaeochromogenes]|uniref:hypothetical protein n=1 Tax=Streptomyces phaeochromogenes TaxID=1923 RepID=UPI002791819F|nr:hypothetical protein [Streptomyces phaeochromogenes]MDQ0951314.1 hypothetical protein [Streptomyces phaeochromogenes]
MSTLAGAVVGVSSALIAERIRWRRDQERDESQTRRVVYSDFLMALSRGHSDMRTVVLQPDRSTGDRLYGDLHQALDGSGIWRLRQSLSLTASAEIIQLAVRTCDALTQMRDELIADPNVRSDTYFLARADLWRENAHLREAMRKDLGMDGPPDPEVGQYRYPAAS